MSDQEQSTVLLKSWECMQNLAKSNGESAWKVKTWAISVWSAMTAYAYTSHAKEVIIVAIVLVVTCLLVEVSIRQVQYKFIEKSLEIEKCVNEILVGEIPRLPATGISTNIQTPGMSDFFKMFDLRRWIIWLPTLILVMFSLIAYRLLP